MTITPLNALILPHRSFHCAVSRAGHIITMSESGVGSFVSPDRGTVSPLKVRFEPHHVAISEDGGLFAVTGGNGVTIYSGATFQPVYRLEGEFLASHFDPSRLLWTCCRQDSESVWIETWESKDWTRVARTSIADPMGDSSFMLFPGSSDGSVAIWAAAGQDGQWLFWARHDNGSIMAERFPLLSDTAPPSFSPSGEEFVVACFGELQRYRYPHGPLIGRMKLEEAFEEDQIDDHAAFLDDGWALVKSLEGRLLLVDLEVMSVSEEVLLRGYEAIRATGAGSRGERRPQWYLSFFRAISRKRFLSIHWDLSGPREESMEHLLTWEIP